MALCGAVVGVRCHRLVISTPPLDRFSTIDVVGILKREFPILNALMKFCDGVLVFMAFMGHVIAEADVIVNGTTWDNGNVIIIVVGSGGRYVLAHRSPFLTLARHEHKISWGQIAYFHKGRVWSRLAGSV